MAIEIPKTKNRNNGPILIIFILFIVVVFFVFISLRKNLGVEINDNSEVISNDTKKLSDLEKNLDKNLDIILNNLEFMNLSKHNDISDQFEFGKTDPFNSF